MDGIVHILLGRGMVKGQVLPMFFVGVWIETVQNISRFRQDRYF